MKKVAALAILVGFIVSGTAVGDIQRLLPLLYEPSLETVQEWSFDNGTTGQTAFAADPLSEELEFNGHVYNNANLSITNGFTWESSYNNGLMANQAGSRIEVNVPNTLLAGKEFLDVMVMIAMGSGNYTSWPADISTSFSGTSAERSSDTMFNLLGFNDGEVVDRLYCQTWRLTTSPDSFTYILELDQTLSSNFYIDEIGIYTDAFLAPEPATICLLSLGGLFLRRKMS